MNVNCEWVSTFAKRLFHFLGCLGPMLDKESFSNLVVTPPEFSSNIGTLSNAKFIHYHVGYSMNGSDLYE